MKYKVTNIKYSIELEDVADEFDEDDFALRSDYIEECEKKIEEIEEDLPSEMIVDIDDDTDTDDVDDAISDVISDKTGWLIESFNFEPVAESREPQE